MSEASERAMRQMSTARRGERIRALETENKRLREGIDAALHELGVPQPEYPAPVVAAIQHLYLAREALSPGETSPPTTSDVLADLGAEDGTRNYGMSESSGGNRAHTEEGA